MKQLTEWNERTNVYASTAKAVQPGSSRHSYLFEFPIQPKVLFTFRDDASFLLSKTDQQLNLRIESSNKTSSEVVLSVLTSLLCRQSRTDLILCQLEVIFTVVGDSSSMKSLSLALLPDGGGCRLPNRLLRGAFSSSP